MASAAEQAAAAALRAGFRGEAAVVAVAIAGAESSWRLTARADQCGGAAGPCSLSCDGYCSWGPWQINICAHADLMRALTGSSSPCTWAKWLQDYDRGARAAYRISAGGTSWSAWTTYRTGAYEAYLSSARAAVAAAGGVLSPSGYVIAIAIAIPLLLLILG
jgi:hypothetical protein